ncbi:hypothetical protein [Nocardioides psychrotolerans]|uniref:GH16 domain-containing protein n=1 Tax=Nocardioides psychrotolerans TaxID=1005945 RepID=A0A1I3NC42_9ACTN|nr:hypothetical protein [Nocardioides psychrotolerans]SFJ06819.1 hypothetical protein SAMN05216561_11784 [Nocardioides psychrotolerans]
MRSSRRGTSSGAVVRRVVAALALIASALVAASLPTQAAPDYRAGGVGTLIVTPAAHVAGQALTFAGKLSKPGRRAIHLQFHMNRPGDRWTDVKGSDHVTTASGAFAFRFPAPSMFDISYRVVGGALVTASRRFYARPQAVTLSINGQDPRSAAVGVASLLPYTVVVDSAADIYTHRELEPPVLSGRTITLQDRTSNHQWRTIGSARADVAGLAAFTLTAPLLGQRVLRARVEDVTTGGNQIGWTASWPTYVGFSLLPDILGAVTPWRAAAGGEPPPTDSTGATDASEQFGWYKPTYDFAWEYGQSLTSPPTRGEKLKGRWLDYSSGSGRVVTFNGALAFQSKLIHQGPGDRGTTSASMTGNAQRYGRWEFRVWQNVYEQDGRDFRMRVELVPEGTAPGACAPESIRVADMELGARSHSVGVRSAQARSEWRFTKTASPAWSGLHNFAVEVAPDHVTWFFDGKAIATTRKRTAISGKVLVPRVSMVGLDNATEHNGAQFSVDWVRAWTLETGRQARTGKALTTASYSPTC